MGLIVVLRELAVEIDGERDVPHGGQAVRPTLDPVARKCRKV
jgi:hypothetical protein